MPEDLAPIPASVKQIHRAITPERAATFLDALRKTGSLHHAAAAASPHLVARGSKHCGVGSFREYARRNPEFAAEVEAALTAVIGEAEALLWDRAKTPDQKLVFNPKTGAEHVTEDRRNANQMLLAWLAAHRPEMWAPKIKNDTTVTHVGNPITSGAQWVIKPDDVLLLADPDDQRLLIALLEKIEDARADAPPVVRQVNTTAGSWATPAVLPAPEGEAQ